MTKEGFTNGVLDAKQTLYRVSMSMLRNEKDCEDAVQEAIFTAYSKLSTLKEDKYFTTWLVRILINVCNKQLKQRRREEPLTYVPENISDNTAENTEIRLAVENLPEKIRQVIVLYYIEQFSVKEIKAILKIPEGTVKSRLSKGRQLLKIEISI